MPLGNSCGRTFANIRLVNGRLLKRGQGHLPGLGRNIGVVCPNKLKIWVKAVQGSSMFVSCIVPSGHVLTLAGLS